MKKQLFTTCLSIAIVVLLFHLPTTAQKNIKTAKANAETISTVSVRPEGHPKVESITSSIKPVNETESTLVTSNSFVSKASATTISTTKLAPANADDTQNENSDTLKSQGNVRVMTHEEIEKMMAEKELVMEGLRNKPAPAFTVTDLRGKNYNLSELKGKTVVLNFWFIGCKPCVMEMPHLNKLVEKYKKNDVVFIALALDSETALQKFLEKNPFHYNIIPDAGKIAQGTYNVSSYPTSIIINKRGIVQDYLIGYSKDVDEKLMAFIDKSLLVK